MSLSKRQREQLLAQHCGKINDDDAIDPRRYFETKRDRKTDRKAFQLSKQIAETLHLVLTDDAPDLDGLLVRDVVPAPDSRRMLVTLVMESLDTRPESLREQTDRLRSLLHEHIPRLRAEIARSITRKKTPQLTFEIVPAVLPELNSPASSDSTAESDSKSKSELSSGQEGDCA